MDLEKFLTKYNNVSREELEKTIKCSGESSLNFVASFVHEQREREKRNGRAAIRSRPLVHVLSVSVRPKTDNEHTPLVIYGTIYAEFTDSRVKVVHELYKRDRSVAQVFSTSGLLILNGPDFSCWSDYACMPLFKSNINVELFDGNDNVFVRQCISLDDKEIEDGFEEVRSKLIPCEQGSLIVQYIAIPFGIPCRIRVMIGNRKISENHDFVRVCGKISVSFGNTYGNYNSEECVIFEKQDKDYELLKIDNERKFLNLSRCWVALPAYSSLVVSVNLWECETKRKITSGTIEILAQQGGMSGDALVLDDIVVQVELAWFSPKHLGRHSVDGEYHCLPNLSKIPKDEVEAMDIEGEDESSDDESADELSSNLNISGSLRPHRSKPWSSPAVEIFSVFIGWKMLNGVVIYGSIEVLSDDNGLCYIFKRDEKDALGLSQHMKSIPVLEGSRVFEHFVSLGMKVDMKDVEGRLAIKGYVDWAAQVLDRGLWHEKQLCSVIQGQHGFAAVHYSIFSEAVGANIKVFLNLKTGCADICPNICGSLIAQYSCYDYSSRYNKDYYRVLLFTRTEDDPLQLSVGCTLPLSRSTVVVPSYSSLVVNVDLSFGLSALKLSCAKEIKIKIGEGWKTIETEDYIVRLELDWCEIK